MKDILDEKIKIECKLKALHLMQQYYSGRMNYSVYKELVAKMEANKKKVLVLIDDEGDTNIRNRLENQQNPFTYYEKNLAEDTNN